MASCDKMVKCCDMNSNQTMQVAAHEAPVKTCHWVKGPTYTCLMTGSWDKTLKVFDKQGMDFDDLKTVSGSLYNSVFTSATS